MYNNVLSSDACYSLLVTIVNRGKGSKFLEFARKNGARDASCILGKGTIKSSLLQFIEMDEVEKEIILIVVPSEKEDSILEELNTKFRLDKPNHGIAFTMPLAGVQRMNYDTSIKWSKSCPSMQQKFEYSVLLFSSSKDSAENAIRISQENGYYGGTLIKARGNADEKNLVLDMIVSPEKEVALMLLENERAKELTGILNEQIGFDNPDNGALLSIGVSKTIGLFQNGKKEEQ